LCVEEEGIDFSTVTLAFVLYLRPAMGFELVDPVEDARKNKLRIHTFDGPSLEDMKLFREKIREQKRIEARMFPLKKRRAELETEYERRERMKEELRRLLHEREMLLRRIYEIREEKKEKKDEEKEEGKEEEKEEETPVNFA
jgi:hypothetical protein